MAGFIAAPVKVPPIKLGWDGQPAVDVPAAGLVLVPGAGLIGRTDASGRLLLDNSSDAVAESFQAFAPAYGAGGQIGYWRNRRSRKEATLAILEAHARTAPTVTSATDYWRVTCTDTLGVSVVLPITTAGQSFYDLDRSAGVDLIRPWPTYVAGGAKQLGTNASTCLQTAKFRPTQGMRIGGAKAWGYTFHMDAFSNPKSTAKWRVRCSLLDAAGDLMAEATCKATGAYDAGGMESWSWVFPMVQTVSANQDYYLTWDIFLDSNGAYCPSLYLAEVSSNIIEAGTPATVGGSAAGSPPSSARDLRWSRAQVYGTAETAAITPSAYVKRVLADPGSGWFWSGSGAGAELRDQSGSTAAGNWIATGTVSGVAAFYGDLAVSLDPIGAPAAGAAGADLTVRAVLLP